VPTPPEELEVLPPLELELDELLDEEPELLELDELELELDELPPLDDELDGQVQPPEDDEVDPPLDDDPVPLPAPTIEAVALARLIVAFTGLDRVTVSDLVPENKTAWLIGTQKYC
jgi:hypothetical protein